MKVLEFGSTGKPTLFLHGFPGVRSKQNKDLAEKAAALGRRAFVPLYSGLGEAGGEFSFVKCRDEIRAYAAQLIGNFGAIDLVGHSWGGYLALGIAALNQEKIGRLVLLSPLLHFYSEDLTEQSFEQTAEGNRALNLGVIADRSKEFVKLGTTEKAETFATLISTATKVSIFQAASDETTPASYVENLVALFKVQPSYEVVATDHSFLTDRDRALARVLTALT